MARETRSHARGASEGPSPTVKKSALSVARGPVPRDRCMARGTRSDARVASEGPSPTVTVKGQMARDRPSPYGEGEREPYWNARCL